MTPYNLERAIEKADETLAKADFADKAVITETFLLVRMLARHAADVEAERLLDTRT